MTTRTPRVSDTRSGRTRQRIGWLLATTAAFVVAMAAPAHATWSIVGTDPATGQVGVAVASCVPGEVVRVPVLAPGQGAAASQANLNFESGPVLLASLQSGAEASAVVSDATAGDPMAQERQFGVVTLGGTVDGFTGSETMPVALNQANAASSATAQGNILVSEQVVTDSLAAFDATEGSLADKLLAALQAGSAAGGDSRCGERTASAAALLVAAPQDPAWQATAANISDPEPQERPSVYLSVYSDGGANPVSELATMYAETPEVDGKVYARDVPWIYNATGLPPAFVYGALAVLAILFALVGGLVWWLVRRSKRRKAAAAA